MMGLLNIQKARRVARKVKIGIYGPSGSGKTFTALRLAHAFAGPEGKILLLDTERGSALNYAGILNPDGGNFDFFTSPVVNYEPLKVIEMLREAKEFAPDVLILDSSSHLWEGIKDCADRAARTRYGGNTWAGWNDARPLEREIWNLILSFPAHVFVTMRSKTEYEVAESGGKKKPVKIGTAPVQKGDVEYEFDLFLSMNPDNECMVEKTRYYPLFGQVYTRPGANLARAIQDWLSDAIDEGALPDDPTWEAERDRFMDAMGKLSLSTLEEVDTVAARLGYQPARLLDREGRKNLYKAIVANPGAVSQIPAPPPERPSNPRN